MISDRISNDISPQMKILNPHSNAFLKFRLKLERCKPHKAARHPTLCDLIITSNYFRQYIAGYTVAIFDVIQSDIALQNQVHQNVKMTTAEQIS